MDIMTTLFDQDYITELYGYEKKEEGRNEGLLEATVNSIRNLMQSLSISCSKAMELLMIPKNEQDTYLQALAEAKSKE